ARRPTPVHQSIRGDPCAPSLTLPFLTCLIVTATVRRRLRHGAIAPLDRSGAGRALLAWLPRRTWLRALVFAGLGGIAFAPVTVAILDTLGVTALGLRPFVVFKASFAALAALVVTPVISLAALAGDVAPAVTGAGQRALQGG